MKFVNEIKEQDLKKLKEQAIDRYIQDLSEEKNSTSPLLAMGFIAVVFSLSKFENDFSFALICGGIGILLILSWFILFLKPSFTKKGELSNREKEEIYKDDCNVKAYDNAKNTFHLLKESNILKHDILLVNDGDEADLRIYYETKENIVEEIELRVEIKKHTKISEYEVHLTIEGFVLYVPYEEKESCGRDYVERTGKCPMCIDCPHNCPLDKEQNNNSSYSGMTQTMMNLSSNLNQENVLIIDPQGEMK
ncbi:MAG: hypothetical protein IJ958_04215 [Agathobacter sp.]|nr:hypothetical protein [Agathobacter sp.]